MALKNLSYQQNNHERAGINPRFSALKLIFIAGFAMFSMFFGSGNLVFPLMVGLTTQSEFHMAAFGLLLTGVLVPFLGLIGMIYSSGNRKLFFQKLGVPVAFTLTLLMLSLLGPFAVVPRCTIVAHGGFSLVAPDINAATYNAFFLAATMAMAWKKTKIIDIIGTYLTPFLLGGILLIIIVSLIKAPPPLETALSSQQSMAFGISQGYQTMDLLAAFFFSATTMTFLAKRLTTPQQKQKLEKYGITASLIGAFLLGSIYVCFVALGAKYAPLLQNIEPEKLLVFIAKQSLGEVALPVSAVVIGLACLTTSSILTSLFVDFIYDDVFKKRISRLIILVLTTLTAYILSLMGFATLAKWIGSILTFVYPALIVYSFCEIICRITKNSFVNRYLSKAGFYVTLFTLIILNVFHMT